MHKLRHTRARRAFPRSALLDTCGAFGVLFPGAHDAREVSARSAYGDAAAGEGDLAFVLRAATTAVEVEDDVLVFGENVALE